jgi:hypothetical protein
MLVGGGRGPADGAHTGSTGRSCIHIKRFKGRKIMSEREKKGDFLKNDAWITFFDSAEKIFKFGR